MNLPLPGVPVHHRPPALSRPDPAPARIVVPFTAVHKDTRAALEPYGKRVEYVNVADRGAYWGLFRDLWAEGRDFVVVEHDTVPRPATIERFDRCRQSWCACSYTWRPRPRYTWMTDRSTKVIKGLGCVRFRAEVMKAAPELGSDAILYTVLENYDGGPLPYFLVDRIMIAVLQGLRGYQDCEHERVGHRQ